MRKLNNSNLTKMFRGFRPGIRPKYKINLKYLEKITVLTSLQHNIVKDALNKCAFTKTIKEEGKEDKNKLIITLDPWYIARLSAIMEKPFNEAKVNQLGDTWTKPKIVTDEDIEKMKQKNRKGKSRKDIKKEKK